MTTWREYFLDPTPREIALRRQLGMPALEQLWASETGEAQDYEWPEECRRPMGLTEYEYWRLGRNQQEMQEAMGRAQMEYAHLVSLQAQQADEEWDRMHKMTLLASVRSDWVDYAISGMEGGRGSGWAATRKRR